MIVAIILDSFPLEKGNPKSKRSMYMTTVEDANFTQVERETEFKEQVRDRLQRRDHFRLNVFCTVCI